MQDDIRPEPATIFSDPPAFAFELPVGTRQADAFDAIPARGAVVLQCVDMTPQRGRRRDTEGIIDAVARQKRSTSGVQ
jgi:hypothetical protein